MGDVETDWDQIEAEVEQRFAEFAAEWDEAEWLVIPE